VRPLGLHHINALDITPVELVSVADEVGCQVVTLFVHVPIPNLPFKPVSTADAPELIDALGTAGIGVANASFFPLVPDFDVESCRPGVELGAMLGARCLASHVRDHDAGRAAESLALLGDLAAEYGMKVGIEFIKLSDECPTLEKAADIVRAADKPNVGVCLDCLHFVRSGGKPEDIAAQPAEVFAYAQLCDGADLGVRSDYEPEVWDRLAPGEGVFPIAAMLDALPAAIHVEIEAPSYSLQQQGVPAVGRARRTVTGARELLERSQPTR
jgi:sugar phosphate isomerase/epimerase